jgi:hypothetical protein
MHESRRGLTMPVIFAAHGAPVLLDEAVWMAGNPAHR